jgi:uncharacterized membrane protein YhaH (DUF805 family)
MPEWKPVGEIEGLFERRMPTTTNEAQLIAADPQAAEPTAWQAQDGAAQEEWPGTRRRGYLFAVLIFPILWAVVLAFAKPFLESQFGKDLPAGALTAIQFIPAVIILLASIQRLANLGMSRLWILGNLVPILNLWIGYRSFACPAGYARHKKMDGVGIFLAIIYWLVIALAIAVLVISALALFGVLGDGEIQNQIKEALEQFKTPAEAPAP